MKKKTSSLSSFLILGPFPATSEQSVWFVMGNLIAWWLISASFPGLGSAHMDSGIYSEHRLLFIRGKRKG